MGTGRNLADRYDLERDDTMMTVDKKEKKKKMTTRGDFRHRGPRKEWQNCMAVGLNDRIKDVSVFGLC